MPVEFALRPRIRLREDAPPRRPRLRIPKLALPVAAYWLVAAGITYALVHSKAEGPAPTTDDSGSAAQPEATAGRAWWQLSSPPAVPDLPPQVPAAELEAAAQPAPAPALAAQPAAEPGTTNEPAAEPALAIEQQRAAAADEGRSSPAPAREHTALGSSAPSDDLLPPLAEEEEANPVRARDALNPPPQVATRLGGLPSCEAVAASANQGIDFSQGNRTADLPTEAIASVLENGAWLSSCSVPASTSIDVCVAIKGGTVAGVSVVSRPVDSAINRCVAQRAAALQFPYSSRVDIARTRF